MGDVIDLVLVQADAFDQIDLDFVRRGEPADEIGARSSAMLRDREQRRNVVAGMRIVRRQKRVVKIQFADRDAIGPGGPFRRHALRPLQSEHRRAGLKRMGYAWARALATGRRAIEAAATAALSMRRLPIISATSPSTATGSAATSAIFQAN